MDSTFTGKQPQDVIWNEFKAEFNGNYFLPDVRKRKEREFWTLKQGPMIVVQYEARFRVLERFASDLVPTERWSIEHFYDGLHHDIHVALIGRTFTTFGDVMRATGEVEVVLATRRHREHDQK